MHPSLGSLGLRARLRRPVACTVVAIGACGAISACEPAAQPDEVRITFDELPSSDGTPISTASNTGGSAVRTSVASEMCIRDRIRF